MKTNNNKEVEGHDSSMWELILFGFIVIIFYILYLFLFKGRKEEQSKETIFKPETNITIRHIHIVPEKEKSIFIKENIYIYLINIFI